MPKDHPRVEAYGAIDELNAAIGLLAAAMQPQARPLIEEIENTLLDIGCILAHAQECTATIEPCRIEALEQAIDKIEAELPPQHSFILPCRGEAAARANLCRTICRRAERRIVALQHEHPVEPQLLEYINRLSDYLFLLQRQLGEGTEKKWDKPCI